MIQKNTVLLVLISLLYQTTIYAQQKERTSETSSTLTVGLEQDLLPYLLNGFIGTGWAGKNKIRVRLSYAEANAPAFILQEGFLKDRTHAVGISVEYFFKEDFKGLWLGPGIGYWDNEVVTTVNSTTRVKSYIFSIGGGYNIYLWKSLYTSPWLALHTRIAGNEKRTIDNFEYKPMLFTPEVSVKLGWRF